jgi:Protein of unknown function, DUF488
MLTAFTWGYYGWGSHTRELVSAVDEVERSRNRKPPIFVDIRLHRNVQAVGFRGNGFAKTIGEKRYRWMKALGNRNIGTRKRSMKIADPSASDELLDLIIEAAKQKRRILLFCSCGYPDRHPIDCHRSVVADLLVKSARKRRRGLKISEWPGESPITAKLNVDPKTVRKVLNGGNRVRLPELSRGERLKFLSLPWSSRVELCSVEGNLAIVSGPAQLGAEWYLHVMGPELSKEADTLKSIKSEAARLYQSGGYAPVAT